MDYRQPGDPYQQGGGQQNEYQNNDSSNNIYRYPPHYAPRNKMAGAARVLGIASIVSTFSFTVYIAFVLGALAILFALLSKGSNKFMSPTAKSGVVSAIIGIVLNIIMVVGVIYVYNTNSEIRQQANEMLEERYGVSLDDIFGNN